MRLPLLWVLEGDNKPVYKGSRYDGSSYVSLRFSDGVTKRFVLPKDRITQDDVSNDWIEHEVTAGEELDELAYRYGGRESSWWIIADVNGIKFPWDIPAGTRLTIPLNLLRDISTVP